MRRRKAPPNTYWRGETLYGNIKVKRRHIRWSLRTSDVELAKQRVKAEREHEVAKAFFGDNRTRYIDAVIVWAEQYIGDRVSASTAARYATSLEQLKPFLIDCHLDEINSAKCKEIVRERRAQGVTIATIKRDLSALSNFLEFTMDEYGRDEDDNPALSRMKRLKERRDPIVLPEHDHINRLVARAPAAMAPVILAALRTGCRQSELVKAARTQLDHVRRQLTVIGKGNKRRAVDLDDETYEALRAIPARLGCKWLFWHHDGQPYKAIAVAFHELVRTEIAETQKRAQDRGEAIPEIQPFTFHHLRHRYAVDFLKAGNSIYTLQQNLGHRSITTTEIYLDFLTPEEKLVAKYGNGAAGAQKESQPKRLA